MKSILSTTFFLFLLATVFSGSSRNPADFAGFQQAQKAEKQKTGWLGVSISDVSKSKADELGLKSSDGALVASVVDDSPADSVGMKEGDVITAFAGRQIYDADDLSKSVRRTAPGTRIALEVYRKGNKKTLTVIIGSRPEAGRTIVRRIPRSGVLRWVSETNSQGMSLFELNEQLGQYFQVPDAEGVLVTEVKKSSAADKAGIEAGDILVRVGGRRIDDAEDVGRAFGKFDKGEKVEIELYRKGSKKTVTLTMEEGDHSWDIFVPEGHFGGEMFIPEGLGDFEYRLKIEEPDLKELHLKLEQMNKSLKQNQEQLRKNIETMVRTRIIRSV